MIKSSYPEISFCNVPVSRAVFHKNLGIYLDEKLNFNHHIKEKIAKAIKGKGVIKKLSRILPRRSLLTIYESFARPHIDYIGVLYDQLSNKSLCKNTDTIQYNAALAITGAMKGTSPMKLCNELVLQSLEF